MLFYLGIFGRSAVYIAFKNGLNSNSRYEVWYNNPICQKVTFQGRADIQQTLQEQGNADFWSYSDNNKYSHSDTSGIYTCLVIVETNSY